MYGEFVGELLILVCTVAVAMGASTALHAADFSEYMGKSDAALEESMRGVAVCNRSPHSVSLPIVTATTRVTRDFFHPVTGSFFSDGGRDAFEFPAIAELRCDIDGSASLSAYSTSDAIFRIAVTYTRCKSKAISGGCLETDEVQRPYDLSIYESLQYKDAYPMSAEGSFYNAYRELRHDPMLSHYIDDLTCGPWVSDFVFNRDREDRCIVNVSATGGIFSATTVFEIYDKGYFTNTLVGRYAGTQTFIDVKAEQATLDQMVTKLENYVSDEQAQIAASEAKNNDRSTRINDLLGPSIKK